MAAAAQEKAAVNGRRSAATLEHVEKAWTCKVRPLLTMTPLRALTVSDIMRAVVIIEERDFDSTTHSWLDVSMPRYASAKRLAHEFSCPAIVVARFNDSVLYLNAKDSGPALVLCGDDGAARVRLQVNKMSPVKWESRW